MASGNGHRRESSRRHDRDAESPRARRPRHAHRTGRRPGSRAAEHYRPRRRPAADGQRRWLALDHVQRRNLQLRRASARTLPARGTSSSRTRSRHRGHPPSRTRTKGRGLRSQTSTASGPSRSGTRASRRLFLSRDRWACGRSSTPAPNAALVFGSEIKALFAHPACSRELDPARPRQDLHVLGDARAAHRVPRRRGASARTFVDRGRRTVVLASRGTGSSTFRRTQREPRDAEAASTEALQAVLDDATRIRLRSDVPVGAYLSGGLDSSLHRRAHQARQRMRRCGRSRLRSTTPSSTRARTNSEVVQTALQHRPPSRCAARTRTSRASFPTVDPARRDAASADGAGAAVSAVTAGPRARLQGRVDRRRRRRDVRAATTSSRKPRSAASGRVAPASPLSAAAAEAALPVSADLQRQPAAYLQAFFQVASGGPRPSRSSRTCRAGELTARSEACSCRTRCGPRWAATTAAPICAARLPARLWRVGSVLPGASIWKPRSLLPGYILVVAGRPRRHGARGRRPLPVPRSPAWSRSRRGCRPR